MSTCSDNGTECKGRFDHGIKTSMEIQTRITKNVVGNFNKNPTTFISSRIHIQENNLSNNLKIYLNILMKILFSLFQTKGATYHQDCHYN